MEETKNSIVQKNNRWFYSLIVVELLWIIVFLAGATFDQGGLSSAFGTLILSIFFILLILSYLLDTFINRKYLDAKNFKMFKLFWLQFSCLLIIVLLVMF